jgi:hypothetical protein
MQRWLYAIVATVAIYLAVLRLPDLIADPLFGAARGKFDAGDFIYHLRPVTSLGLATWALFGPEKPLARWWRLGGVAVIYAIGLPLLRGSVEFLSIGQTYDFQPALLLLSIFVIGLGLLVASGEVDQLRLRRCIVALLLAGTGGCLFIDFLHWAMPPATLPYSVYQSLPTLLLAGGVLLGGSGEEPLGKALVRWTTGYAVATAGASILLHYREAARGFWYWMFGGLYADAAIGVGSLVVLAAAVILAPPQSLFQRLAPQRP